MKDITKQISELIPVELGDELVELLHAKELIDKQIDETKAKIRQAAMTVHATIAEPDSVCFMTPEDARVKVVMVSDSLKVCGDVSRLPQHLQVNFEAVTTYKLRKDVDGFALLDRAKCADKKLLESVIKRTPNVPRIEVK